MPARAASARVELLAALHEALQERAAIERRGPLQGLRGAIRDQPLEQHHVDLEAVRSDGDVAGVGGEAMACLVGQALAQARQCLAQVGARLGFGVPAPQQTGKLAAAVASRRGRDQIGEQRPDLADRKTEHGAIGRAALETAEQRHVQQRHPPEASAILSRLRRRASVRAVFVPLLSRARGRPGVKLARIWQQGVATMSEREAWQVSDDAAVLYERSFVPAIFARSAVLLADASRASATRAARSPAPWRRTS
jgi:hypothetical protein